MEILNVGPLELIIILVIMFILLGPKDMVLTAARIGRWIRGFVRSPMWREILTYSQEIRELPKKLLDETGLEETLKEVKQTTQEATNEINEQLREVSNAARVQEAEHLRVGADAPNILPSVSTGSLALGANPVHVPAENPLPLPAETAEAAAVSGSADMETVAAAMNELSMQEAGDLQAPLPVSLLPRRGRASQGVQVGLPLVEYLPVSRLPSWDLPSDHQPDLSFAARRARMQQPEMALMVPPAVTEQSLMVAEPAVLVDDLLPLVTDQPSMIDEQAALPVNGAAHDDAPALPPRRARKPRVTRKAAVAADGAQPDQPEKTSMPPETNAADAE